MRVTLDLDTNSTYHLTKTLWKARDYLGNVRVFVSSSGLGFHIEGNNKTKLDNLMVRALLDDDPVRIRFSLKRLALGGESEILFQTKNGKKRIEITSLIPFDKINNADLDDLEKISEKIQGKVGGILKEVWTVNFELKDVDSDSAKEILEDIRAKDETFHYKILPNLYKKGKTKWIVSIWCDSKDQAHQRGMWFIKKTTLCKSYWVKKIELHQK